MKNAMEKVSKEDELSARKDEEEAKTETAGNIDLDSVKVKQEKIDDYEEAEANRYRLAKSVNENAVCNSSESKDRYSDELLRRAVEVVIKREPGLDATGLAISSEQKPCKIVSRKSLSGSVKQGKADIPQSRNGEMSGSGDAPEASTSTDDAEKRLAAKAIASTSQGPSTSSASSTNTRLTRSQNPEFLAKQKHFLQKVNSNLLNTSGDGDSSVVSDASDSADTVTSSGGVCAKRKREKSLGPSENGSESSRASPTPDSTGKKRRNSRVDTPVQPSAILDGTDKYCWTCHREGIIISCITCPRAYHLRCTQLNAPPAEQWVCPECVAVVRAENVDTRSRSMRLLSLDQLCNLLKYALSRMKAYPGSEPFVRPVDQTEFPRYREFVVHPMDLTQLERNIRKKQYGSTEAFLSDAKWLLHNCIVFNTPHAKLSSIAKGILKICKQEMSEIETCPDCYLNAHVRKESWFVDVCKRPHVIVWAKLKGFPFWPAKVMRTRDSLVDVRFFGAHDRAWVPIRDCFLYSRTIPAAARNKKRNNLEICIQEVEKHVKRLRDKYGQFNYAPFRTPYDPKQKQLRLLLPLFQDEDDDGEGEAESEPDIKTNPPEESPATQRILSLLGEKQEEKQKEADSPTEEADVQQEEKKEIIISEKKDEGDYASIHEDEADADTSAEVDEITAEKDDADTEPTKFETSLMEWAQFEEKVSQIDLGVVEDDTEEKSKDEEEFDDEMEPRPSDSTPTEAKEEPRSTTTVPAEKVALTSEDRLPSENNVTENEESYSSCSSSNDEEEDDDEEEDNSLEKEISAYRIVRARKLHPNNSDEAGPSTSDGKRIVGARRRKMKVRRMSVSALKVASSADDGKSLEPMACDDADEGSLSSSSSSSSKSPELEWVDAETIRKFSQPPKNLMSNLMKTLQSGQPEVRLNKLKNSEIMRLSSPTLDNIPVTVSSSTLETVSLLEAKFKEANLHIGEDQSSDAPSTSRKEDDGEEKSKEEDSSKVEGDEGEKISSTNNGADVRNEAEVSSSGDKKSIVLDKKDADEDVSMSDVDRSSPITDSADKSFEEKSLLADNSTIASDDEKLLLTECTSDGTGSTVGSLPDFHSRLDEVAAEPKATENPEEAEENAQAMEVDHDDTPPPLENSDVGDSGKDNEDVPENIEETKSDPKISEDNKEDDTAENEKQDESAEDKEDEKSESVDEERGEKRKLEEDDHSNKDDDEDDKDNANNKKKRKAEGEEEEEDEKKDESEKENSESEKDKDDSAVSDESKETDKSTEEKAEASSTLCGKVKLVPKENLMDNRSLQMLEARSKGNISVKRVTGDRLSTVKSSSISSSTEKEKATPASIVKDRPSSKGDDADEKHSSDREDGGGKLTRIKEEPDDLEEDESCDGIARTKGKGRQKGELASIFEEGECRKTDSPMSEKDGIPPSYLYPNVTITVENDKQVDTHPLQSRDGTINIDAVKASVGLPKAISLSIVNSGKDLDAPLDMECDHESDQEDGPTAPLTTSTPTTSSSSSSRKSQDSTVTTTASYTITGHNSLMELTALAKGKRLKSIGATEIQQGPSKARKSFPNRPHPQVKITPASFASSKLGNSVSLLRRTLPAGTDVRRSSFSGFTNGDVTVTTVSSSSSNGSGGNGDLANDSGASASASDAPMASIPSVPAGGKPTVNGGQYVNGVMEPPAGAQVPGSVTPAAAPLPPASNVGGDASNRTRISPTSAATAGRMPSHLQHRPPGQPGPLVGPPVPPGPSAPPGPPPYMPNGMLPSDAGPVSADLSKHSKKMAEYLRSVMEEMLREVAAAGNMEAKIKSLHLEMEKMQWRHQQEMNELKRNADVLAVELRNSLLQEQQRALQETIRQCEVEKQRAIEETKKKQWCTNCGKEAIFYCCWNTSYCDYPCQQRHWPQHMASCGQADSSKAREAAENGLSRSPQQQNRSPATPSPKSGNGPNYQQPWVESVPYYKSSSPSPNDGSRSLSPMSMLTIDYADDGTEDPNNNPAPASRKGIPKRKRCGKCEGCESPVCGKCPPCTNVKTHQVCRQRRCLNLQPEVSRQAPPSQQQQQQQKNHQPHMAVATSKVVELRGAPPPQYVSGGQPPPPPPPPAMQGPPPQGPRPRLPPPYNLMPMARPSSMQVVGSRAQSTCTSTSSAVGTRLAILAPTSTTPGSPHSIILCHVSGAAGAGYAATAHVPSSTTATTTSTHGVRPTTTTLLHVKQS